MTGGELDVLGAKPEGPHAVRIETLGDPQSGAQLVQIAVATFLGPFREIRRSRGEHFPTQITEQLVDFALVLLCFPLIFPPLRRHVSLPADALGLRRVAALIGRQAARPYQVGEFPPHGGPALKRGRRGRRGQRPGGRPVSEPRARLNDVGGDKRWGEPGRPGMPCGIKDIFDRPESQQKPLIAGEDAQAVLEKGRSDQHAPPRPAGHQAGQSDHAGVRHASCRRHRLPGPVRRGRLLIPGLDPAPAVREPHIDLVFHLDDHVRRLHAVQPAHAMQHELPVADVNAVIQLIEQARHTGLLIIGVHDFRRPGDSDHGSAHRPAMTRASNAPGCSVRPTSLRPRYLRPLVRGSRTG
uniref:FunD3 n=1 Tax=Streptosporangium sp. KD35 TaxID=2162663 RepID=A0A2U9KCZ7_9ACTN|nr:FunD3 [Streptosporangium sp. KD35]